MTHQGDNAVKLWDIKFHGERNKEQRRRKFISEIEKKRVKD